MSEQTVIVDYPPLYAEIARIFHLHKRTDVIFAWGPDRIYNPHNAYIPPQLMAHEAVHGTQQGHDEDSIAAWWFEYCRSPAFRLQQEVEAHRAEYGWLIEHGNREQRRTALKQVGGRLAGTLYGSMVTGKQAKRLLRGERGNDRTVRSLRENCSW